jgi:hypothetical protein
LPSTITSPVSDPEVRAAQAGGHIGVVVAHDVAGGVIGAADEDVRLRPLPRQRTVVERDISLDGDVDELAAALVGIGVDAVAVLIEEHVVAGQHRAPVALEVQRVAVPARRPLPSAVVDDAAGDLDVDVVGLGIKSDAAVMHDQVHIPGV